MPPAPHHELLALPPHAVGEIIDGVLCIAQPRLDRARVRTMLCGGLGLGLRSDWLVLLRIELHLHDDVLVPDLSGWHRERISEMRSEDAYVTLTPDWVCEMPTRSTDRTRKLVIYARERVPHVWFIDPATRTLEVMRLDGDLYRVVLEAKGDEVVRAEPFDAIELELATLWAL